MGQLVVLERDARSLVTPYARAVLVRADALGRVPTPLEEITEALAIAKPEELFPADAEPLGILKRLTRLRGRVLGAFAVRERVIYLDHAQPSVRVRFAHGHELGHSAIPWHRAAYYGDDRNTLAPDTRDLLEAEASSFASDLLFQLELFGEQAAQSRLGLAVPLELADIYCASYHASIRRYVQENRAACGLVIFGRFPTHVDGGRGLPRLVALESSAFLERFGPISVCVPKVLSVNQSEMGSDCSRALKRTSPDPVIVGEQPFETVRGSTPMRYELFFNGYVLFCLVYPKRRIILGKPSKALWTPDEPA